MANLTLSIDDDLLRRARIKALEHGTSVNALLREYLEAFTGAASTRRALDAFLEIAARHRGRGPDQGRTWTRDELHDR